MTIHRLQHAGQILLKEIIGLQRVEDEPAQFKLFSHWERQPNKNQSISKIFHSTRSTI